MKVTEENAKEFAHNVMTPKDVQGYNKLHGTDYQNKDELLTRETAKAIAEFFNPEGCPKNKHAQALGRLSKGKPKHFSPEEIAKRTERLRLGRMKKLAKRLPDLPHLGCPAANVFSGFKWSQASPGDESCQCGGCGAWQSASDAWAQIARAAAAAGEEDQAKEVNG